MFEGLLGGSRLLLVFLVVLVVLVSLSLLVNYLPADSDVPSYPYSELLADAAGGRVESISQDGSQLTVTIAGEAERRTVQVASDSINVYAEVCAATGNPPGPACPIQYEVVAQSETSQVLGYVISALLPVILIGVFFAFMMRASRTKKE